jgi:hypothetical protein
MGKANELEQAVYDINCDISDIDMKIDDTAYSNCSLIINSDGFSSTVSFLGEVIYNTNDDGRLDWDDEKDDYAQSIEQHLRQEMQDMALSVKTVMTEFMNIKEEPCKK